jgi:hypothetical protein
MSLFFSSALTWHLTWTLTDKNAGCGSVSLFFLNPSRQMLSWSIRIGRTSFPSHYLQFVNCWLLLHFSYWSKVQINQAWINTCRSKQCSDWRKCCDISTSLTCWHCVTVCCAGLKSPTAVWTQLTPKWQTVISHRNGVKIAIFNWNDNHRKYIQVE